MKDGYTKTVTLEMTQKKGRKTMPQITVKELGLLADRMYMEQMLVGKYENYASEMTDDTLRNLCTNMADQHRAHLDTLYAHLK